MCYDGIHVYNLSNDENTNVPFPTWPLGMGGVKLNKHLKRLWFHALLRRTTLPT
jgi:hypothetical protein